MKHCLKIRNDLSDSRAGGVVNVEHLDDEVIQRQGRFINRARGNGGGRGRGRGNRSGTRTRIRI